MSDETAETKPEIEALADGYRAFREWARAMADAGQPLPPGGTCMITRSAVLTARLIDLRCVLAEQLAVPPKAIRIDIDVHPLSGHLTPVVDIDFPEGYMAVPHPSIVDPEGKTPADLGQEHAQAVIREFYGRFLADVNGRMDAMARSGRPDLEIVEWEDMLDARADGKDGDPSSAG